MIARLLRLWCRLTKCKRGVRSEKGMPLVCSRCGKPKKDRSKKQKKAEAA